MKNMKRRLLLLSFMVAFPVVSSWAAVIGSTNAADFAGTTVDWCQLGCTGDALAQSLNWTTTSGASADGLVFLTNGSLYSLVAGPDPAPDPAPSNLWISDFRAGKGVVYNGVDFGNDPGSIFIAFNQPQLGVGAYISSDYFGSFNATLTLYDSGGNLLGSFLATGNASSTPDTSLFIGAASLSGGIALAEFSATGSGPSEPNFAIGTMRMGVGCTGDDDEGENDDFCHEAECNIPEPASLLLMTPALLGLIAFTRRRKG